MELTQRGYSMQAALEEVGFSPSYAKNGNIKKTKTWQEIMDQSFPDTWITGIHRQQLNAKRLEQKYFSNSLTDDEIQDIIEAEGFTFIGIRRFMNNCVAHFSVPDTMARDKALDKVYKLKKRYDNTIKLDGQLNGLSDEDIDARIAGIISGVVGSIAGKGKKKK